MTKEELALYALTAYDLGDFVEIDESGLIGQVIGMEIKIGCEDRYLVAYHDFNGNPHRVSWPASALELADEDGPDLSNVVCLDCERNARATRH